MLGIHRQCLILVLALAIQHCQAACGDPGEAFFNDNGKPQGGFTSELASAVACLVETRLCDSSSLADAAIGSSSSDTSKVAAFYGATVTNFCVIKVTDFSGTFTSFDTFNQPLLWDTSNAITLEEMFYAADQFNQPLNWNVAKVVNFAYTFSLSAFNQDISFWDTSQGVTFLEMFDGAYRFSGVDLSSWTISSGCDYTRMFRNVPTFNFDMNSWGPQIEAKDCSGSAPITTNMFELTLCPGPATPVLGAYCQFAPPSASPSQPPSGLPSRQPSARPSRQPSGRPSARPSPQPSARPSQSPSRQPTMLPFSTNSPSARPSRQPSARPSTKPSRLPSQSPSAFPSRQFYLTDYVKANVDKCFQRIFVLAKCNCWDPRCVDTALRTRCKFTFKLPRDRKSYQNQLRTRIRQQCLILAQTRQRTSVPTLSPTVPSTEYPTISAVPTESPTLSTLPSISIAPSSASPVVIISARAAASQCFQRIFFLRKCRCANLTCIRKTKRRQCKFAFATEADQQTYKKLLRRKIARRCQ